MFLPRTAQELKKLKRKTCDVIIVTGDAYIDSSFNGAAVIGKYLEHKGYTVGIISQPDINTDEIKELGEPNLFWGVTAGCVDSMVSNFTATLKRRKEDDFTPGGINNRRPDNASVVYSNLIRRHFKSTKPIVLGGIEASLRRVAHYDYVKDRIKRSVLFDAKADYLIYGMGEKTAAALAHALKNSEDPKKIPGLCYAAKDIPEGFDVLPSAKECEENKDTFTEMFMAFYRNELSGAPKGIVQQNDTRYLVQTPPFYYTQEDMDEIYGLDFERAVHPHDISLGEVRAIETIRFSITTHRGCFGGCNFCAITAHQGRKVIGRSERSIIAEAEKIAKMPGFKGYITDLGGPTANMYGMQSGSVSHKDLISLLKKIRKVPGVKKVFVGSGVRYDIILKDEKYGVEYLEELVSNHLSGQMKIAPEHTMNSVLKQMGKPPSDRLSEFKRIYDDINDKHGLRQQLTYYFIAAHPGCSMDDMCRSADFIQKNLKTAVEQAQVFTPTPSTISSLMYHTGKNPFTGDRLFVEKNIGAKDAQKRVLYGE